MTQSGYDPSAAASVWPMVVDEEQNAVAKSLQPGLFSKTHPSSEDRITKIKNFIEANYVAVSRRGPEPASHVKILNRYYMMLMEDQIDTNRFGRTENMLERHRKIGVNPALIEFFYGEMYRQRNSEGDLELARQSYESALQTGNPIADVFRNLGYVHLKQGRQDKAMDNFRLYLDLKPDADDRAMIEFYLEE